MPNKQQVSRAAGNYTRINGVTSEQTVTSSETIVHEISASVPSGASSAATVTVKDGTTVVHVMEVAIGGNTRIDPNVVFGDGLRITPSTSDVDVFAAYTS